MKTAKKVLGVLVALAMLLNVFAMMSFAMTPDTAIDLLISADKASYKQGDTVTFTVSVETTDSITELLLNGNYPIAYDGNVIKPIGAVDALDAYNIVNIQPGYDSTISGVFPLNEDNCPSGLTWDNQSWNAGIMLSLADDATSFAANGKVDMFTFQMKIADDAADGDYVVGFNGSLYATYDAYLNGYFGATGDESGVSEANTYGYGTVTIHVGETAAASIIKDGGAQIRFRGIGQNGTVADYKGEFDVRTVATISQADFVANFGTDANAIEKITDIGFVYATATNVPAFDADTAKGVAEGTAATGYVKAPVNYIQHAADGDDYRFTCLIRNIADADKNETVNALAYVCYDGNYFYFDAPVAVSYATLYERMPK